MLLREKWLLSILSGIFVVQAAVFVWGFNICAKITPQVNITQICPDIGRRFDNTFGGMVATTLALLTGATVMGNKSSTTTRKTPPPPGRQ